MKITDTERDTYREIWQYEEYAAFSPGERYAQVFTEMSGAQRGDSVLDAGCGSGKGTLALAALGLRPRMCDITNEGLVPEARKFPFVEAVLWRDVFIPHDYVYCCDVMEHVPLPFVMLVVDNLLSACTKGAFFSITLQPDAFGTLVGKSLHQSVQSFVQWRDQLSEVGKLVECRDLGNVGLYYLVPR